MPINTPPEPWLSLLQSLDSIATTLVHLHCIGGFVATQMYGSPRGTEDIEPLSIVPSEEGRRLVAAAGKGSSLHRQSGVYLEQVGVANYPDEYESRLTEMYAGQFEHLRLLAVEAHDLVLAKP